MSCPSICISFKQSHTDLVLFKLASIDLVLYTLVLGSLNLLLSSLDKT